MQKKIISIILILALLMPTVVFAADTTTKKYSDITKFSSDYSYGTLFWTEESEVKELNDNKSTPGEENENQNYIFVAKPGEGPISVKITKCAVDKAGDLCDVICKIDNIQKFSIGDDSSCARLKIQKYGSSNLVKFWFETVAASGHFTMQYVKAGTETPAKVQYAAASIGDIDVSHEESENRGSESEWYGCEGFTVDGADSEVYYNKDNNYLTDATGDKGVRTPAVGKGINKYKKVKDETTNEEVTVTNDDVYTGAVALVEKDNDLDKNNSAVVTENMGSDATFKLFYTGYGCGIMYVFASPYAFELDQPIKTSTKAVVSDGDTFTYNIKQYVPNNYYASELSFVDNSEGKYSSFTIEDTLDSNLELDGTVSDIKIVDESNKAVTFFDIAFTDNKMTATAKTEALTNIDFYAHTYSISIPVKVKNLTDKDITSISNKAITTAKIGTNDPEVKEGTVNVDIKYTVTFDSNGGTTPPADQLVPPKGKATNPTDTTVTKDGYTFDGWSITDPDVEDAQKYDFDTEVNRNITLYAIWNPNEYNINYVLNATDATNDSTNPTKYKTGTVITSFKEPTRPGYTFAGWYADEALTTEFPGIKIDDHENKTLYAKWTPVVETKANYKVEYYLQSIDGTKYELDSNGTQTLSDDIGKTVTATPRTIAGYKENTTHEDRVPSGTVTADGSLVLKLYYDREEYKVTFDTKGGTPKPEDQTKKYGEKAVKPTSPTADGYTFKGWYYINSDNKEVQYNFDDPVTHDVNLYAKWESNPKDINDNPVTPGKVDPSTSPNVLPYTGKATIIILAVSISLVVILGKKYHNLKDIK